ncbi:MAG: hypothetical protein ABIT76_01010 [Chthoniobacterales bacterium]
MNIPRERSQSSSIALTQPWQETPDAGFQQSRVQLHWEPAALHVSVQLDDTRIVSSATGHNQSLHLLGDTLEVFLKRPESESYLELHVDPQNFRTALRWPPGGIERVRENTGTRVEDFRIDPESFGSRVQIFPDAWHVAITVPPVLLDLETWSRGQTLQFSISRYDYAEGTPILSTVAAHAVKNFHRTTDWLPATLL